MGMVRESCERRVLALTYTHSALEFPECILLRDIFREGSLLPSLFALSSSSLSASRKQTLDDSNSSALFSHTRLTKRTPESLDSSFLTDLSGWVIFNYQKIKEIMQWLFILMHKVFLLIFVFQSMAPKCRCPADEAEACRRQKFHHKI